MNHRKEPVDCNDPRYPRPRRGDGSTMVRQSNQWAARRAAVVITQIQIPPNLNIIQSVSSLPCRAALFTLIAFVNILPIPRLTTMINQKSEL